MPTTTSTRFDLGGCTVTFVDAGRLKMDGGAMFGIIPKALWSRGFPADEQNRIALACNAALVEWPGTRRRLLIETGRGVKYSEKELAIYDADPGHWLRPALHEMNIEPESVTDVVLTHLHFDHAGGLTWVEPGSAVARPTLPRAAVHSQRREYEDARAEFGLMTASYRDDNFAPIDDADLWRLHDGEVEIAPGVRLRPTPGHTRGHQSVVVTGRERTLIFAGDVLPTQHHVGAPYNMSFDLFPLENRETKRRLLELAVERRALLALGHDPSTPVVTVVRQGDWFELSSAVPVGAR